MPYKNKEDQRKWERKNRLRINVKRQQRRKIIGRKKYPEKEAQWVRDNRERCCIAALRGRAKKLYGISLDKFAAIHEMALTGACEICGRSPTREERNGKRRLHIDHPKGERRMRGLLCHHCNTGLGAFQDDIKILQAAINYLIADSKKGG
jgi:hypothetical protein